MVSPEVGAPIQTARSRSVRGYIVFAFAIALVLAIAYLMREILMLLYVSALFAVVLTPVDRGIIRLHIGSWHPGRGLGYLFPAAERRRGGHPVFRFRPAARPARFAIVDQRSCQPAAHNSSISSIGSRLSLTSIFPA